MTDLELKRYEISLWDDVLVTEGEGSNVHQYFDEQKLCVIGSNEMSSWARATNPVFTENTNGQKTLTFSMVTRFYDENREDFIQNPFLSLLVNERKVKLFYNPDDENDEFNNGWYDLIIKNIQENKSSNTFSYTAQSAPINELSKTGFNLEFDPELQNNMGKITELAERVVDGTDWKIRATNEGSDLLQQYIEEPVYWYDIQEGDNVTDLAGETLDPQPTKVYIFYSQMQDNSDNEVIAALPILVGDDDLPIANDDTVLVDREGHYVPNVKVTFYEWPDPAHYGLEDHGHTYRGMRLNRHQTSVYDPKLRRYVNVYEDTSHNRLYGYTETKYISPVIVQDFVVNGKDFTNIDGWDCNGNDSLKLKFETQPVTNSYLEFIPTEAENSHYLFNNGIYYMRSSIHDFTEGETYICRFKSNNEPLNIFVADYDLNEGVYEIDPEGQVYFDFNFSNVNIDEDGYYTTEANCTQSLSYEQLLRQKIGFLVKNGTNSYKVYEMQFYKKVEVDGTILKPGDAPTQDLLEFIPRYYDPNQEGYEDIDSIVYLPDENYTPVYDEDYEKIRSITIKESNRYNIIQTLCETFECWARFEVAHESNGKIKLEDGVPKKYISFHEYIGDDNYAGFRYQVNLKDIQRTLVSDQLVTKIVVKANSNEFAPHGFCTIARADENPTKENFILDFSHYVQHNLLNINQITNDLYLDTSGYIGYYKKLAELNAERDEKIELLTQLLTTQNQLEAAYQVAYLADEAANKLFNTAIGEWLRYKGSEYVAYDDTIEDPMAQQIQVTIEVQRQAAESYGARVDALDEQLEENEEKVDELKHYLYEETEEGSTETLYSKKKALDAQFYKKYSRFIQEGSWISEDYVDDNLYFIDAQNTLRTSAQPQITYNISVMALDALEGYQGYRFKVGDKTYVEDEEFFGYVPGASVLTPYHEEVIVSQVQWNLDNPAQNNITVQNFKTRFQDLFQRITAQTQALQYSNGAYQKAANVVTTEGAITETALGKALINSTLILSNARDQSVVIDESGISITDLTNYREIVRLVSGGILLSNDGGQTWSNAITGDGINANYITAGQIDTALIRVGSGAWPSFRWDANGLVAYAFDKNPDTGLPQNFQFNRLVRFDQYGLYGYQGQSDFIPNSLDDVWNNAQFSVTWKGFKLNSNNNGGYISITSDNDIGVYQLMGQDRLPMERIKIGRISETENYYEIDPQDAHADDGQTYYYYHNGQYYEVDWSDPPDVNYYYIRDWLYGIRISDAYGDAVMETGSDGNLWLKNTLIVGDGETSTTTIGYNQYTLDDLPYYIGTTHGENNAHEIIVAGARDPSTTDTPYVPAFVVYEDGHIRATSADITGTIHAIDGEFNGTVYATNGSFTGHINATSGTIGNVDITDFVDSIKTVTINSANGSTVTKTNNTYNPTVINLTASLSPALNNTSGNYSWYINDQIVANVTSANFSFNPSSYGMNTALNIKAGYGSGANITYSNEFPLSYVEMADIEIDNYQVYFNDAKITKIYNDANAEPNIRPGSLNVGLKLLQVFLENTDYTFSLQVIINNNIQEIFNDVNTAVFPIFESNTEPTLEYDSTDKFWSINLGTIITHEISTAQEATYPTYNLLRNALLSDTATLRFTFYVASKWVATTDLIVTAPIYDSLMRFAVTAQSINAAIGNRAMTFNENGLVISNAGLKIQKVINETYEDLLYYDTSKNELVVKGNIQADSGKFHGRIEATDGYIQSLTINNGNNTITLGTTTVDGQEFIGIRAGDAFSIDTEGNVIAQSIKLGQGAEIEDYIQLGNAYIRNPEQYDHVVFEILDNGVSTFTIKDNGIGTIGNLTFDGNTGTLTGADGGISTWSIDPTDARFYNIYAQGKISTAIFESNTVRVSGGSMIFKNGAIIKGINGRVLTVDDTIGLNINDKIWIIKDGSSFESVVFATITNVSPANKTITIDVNPPADADTIITLGTLTNGKLSDWIIGVNSTSGDYNNVGLHRNAISFNSASLDNNVLNLTQEIVLGDLTGVPLGTKMLSGSGLFAQNAFLTGTLTTQYKNVSGGSDNIQYAGVNTFGTGNGVIFNKIITGLENDNSNIIFWAGASGIEDDKIQDAPFQVTANGTLYAKQGYFEGSILTKATITASEIITPVITGQADGANWLLTLRTPNAASSSTDTQGFIFLDGNNTITSFTSSTAYFNNNLLLQNNKQISFNGNNSITNINESQITSEEVAIIDTTTNKRIHLLGNRLSYENKEGDTWGVNGSISYNDTENGLVTSIANDVTIITNTYFKNLQDTYLNKSVYFGTDNMFYQAAKGNQETGGIGYNLYVNATIE